MIASFRFRTAIVAVFLASISLVAAKANAGLLVSNQGSGAVLLYGDNLSFQKTLIAPGVLTGTVGMALRGNDLYVSHEVDDHLEIRRFNATTGANLEKIADGPVDSLPGGLAFGPDGNLYVADRGHDSVLRVVGLGTVPFASDVNMISPTLMEFQPSGLYVSSLGAGAVFKFNPTTGAGAGTVASGVQGATGVHVGSDGKVYVAGVNDGKVFRFDVGNPTPATFIDTGTNTFPSALLFAPNGDVVVTQLGNFVQGIIQRYSQTGGATNTGVFINQDTRAELSLPGNVIYTPLPEPSTLLMAIAGVGILVAARVRRGAARQ